MANQKTSMKNTNNDSFRILTYNLWCHRFVGGRHSAQRLHTFASWLLDESTQFYDIICLQEVFVCNPLLLFHYGSDQRTNLIKTVKVKYPYSCTAYVPWFRLQDSGCLILSAHHLEPCHQESFANYNLSELVTHKGFMCCKITIGHKEIIVVNTHLHAGNAISTAIRVKQLKQIHDHISTYHSGHRVILCGDLNIEYGSKEYYDMLKSLSINILLTDSTPKAAATYMRLVRLDYILISKYFIPIESNVVSADKKNQNNFQLMVSDHEGLESKFKFTNVKPSNVQNMRVLRFNKFTSTQIKRLMLLLITLINAIIFYYFYQSYKDSRH